MQVFQSWYLMGRMGAFNSSNLQVWPSLTAVCSTCMCVVRAYALFNIHVLLLLLLLWFLGYIQVHMCTYSYLGTHLFKY